MRKNGWYESVLDSEAINHFPIWIHFTLQVWLGVKHKPLTPTENAARLVPIGSARQLFQVFSVVYVFSINYIKFDSCVSHFGGNGRSGGAQQDVNIFVHPAAWYIRTHNFNMTVLLIRIRSYWSSSSATKRQPRLYRVRWNQWWASWPRWVGEIYSERSIVE